MLLKFKQIGKRSTRRSRNDAFQKQTILNIDFDIQRPFFFPSRRNSNISIITFLHRNNYVREVHSKREAVNNRPMSLINKNKKCVNVTRVAITKCTYKKKGNTVR